MNKPLLNLAHRRESNWTYASLLVLDGQRQLKPVEVSFDRLYFAEPPQLTSSEVEIILTNGDAEQRHRAVVLPHDVDATFIPIRLLPMQ